MKAARAALLIWLAAVTPAMAQGWQEYRDPALGCTASFPATPTASDTTYKLLDGTTSPARLIYLRQGNSEYRLIVADFTNAALQGDAAIAAAAKTLSAGSKVTVDIAARVNQNYGRQLGVTASDGSQSVSAIFFVDHRLYLIEGVTHPGEDANSSNAARFQQSLNFGGGYGGRGGGGFFRRSRP